MERLGIKRSFVLSCLVAVLLLSAACSNIPQINAPLPSQGTGQAGQARIGWPFDTSTGHWVIENGYNWNTSNGGLDHGCSTTGQTCYEQYSFDFRLAGTSGSTIGATILSPASGALVEFGSAAPGDGTSGYCASISITGYSGYHVLVCHLQTRVQDRAVARGDIIGQVAGGKYGDHIHMTLYYLDPTAGGDTSANAPNRKATPFTDPWTIAGCSYPSNGSADQWGNPSTAVPCATSSPIASATPSAPTPMPSATPTTSLLAACRAISGFATAGSPGSLANNFLSEPSVPFPTSSLGYTERTFNDPSVDQPGMVYHFDLIAVCSPATTPDAVRSFFSTALPAEAGWFQSDTFPYDGNYSSQCGDPYCWAWGPTGGDISRFASLEEVKQVSTAVTYVIRLGVEAPVQ